MAGCDLQRELNSMECHFNWQLECSSSFTLEKVQRDLEDRLRCECNWIHHVYNDLGYVLHAQGSKDEALTALKKGEELMKSKKDHGDCSLLINQANMAWVYYHKGELEKSQACLEEVARLQQKFPTPEGSQTHPMLSAQKGWTLMRFENSHMRHAIESFKIALTGDPENKNFHKGLALAMENSYNEEDFKYNPDLQRQIIDQLKVARDKYKNEDVCLGALHLMSLLEYGNGCGEALEEANKLADKLIASGKISGLSNLISLYTYHLMNYDKAINVAEQMLDIFPDSIRAKKNLAHCFKGKIYTLGPNEREERKQLSLKAIDLYKQANAVSFKENIGLAIMCSFAGDSEAAEQIYKNLLERDLTDAEKQLALRRYAEHMYYKESRDSSEVVDLYMRAARIPVVSEHRDTCIRRLRSIVRYGRHERCEEIRRFLLNLNA